MCINNCLVPLDPCKNALHSKVRQKYPRERKNREIEREREGERGRESEKETERERDSESEKGRAVNRVVYTAYICLELGQ